MLKIDKGIPIPIKTGVGGGMHPLDTIPWDEMEVGDSVLYIHSTASGIKKRAAK